MPNFDATVDLVKRYLQARVPLIVIRSIEPGRAREVVGTCAAELRQMAHYEHSRTEGFKDLLTGHAVDDETSLTAAFEIARRTFRSRTNVNVLFHDIEDIADESTTSRHVAEMVRLAQKQQGTMILIVAAPVWTGLARLGMSVALDMPDADELTGVLAQMVDDHRGAMTVEWQYDEVRQAAEVLAGVTEDEAVNSLATLLARGRLAVSDLAELASIKDQIFGDLSGIERVALRDEYRVGGLRSLRSWLATRETLMKADLSHTRLPAPRGVLLVGISGCGKSLSAKAIAHDWQLPLYRLDMSSVLGMYVGQSEGRLREALEMAERVAPCVLWIDEIEKALAAGAHDGTARRMIGQFLFWLQESTSKVFVVATANDVSMLPSELLRKGRFDEMFFIDLPDASDREEIIRLSFERYLELDPAPGLTSELVALSEGFTGSDIDAVVREVATHQFAHNLVGVPDDAVVRTCFQNVVPYSRTNAEEVASIRTWGLERCVPAGADHRGVEVPAAAGVPRRVVVL